MSFLLVSLLALLLSAANAFPVPNVPSTNGAGIKDFFCAFPTIKEWFRLCPRQDGDALNIITPIGIAQGVQDTAGATRFAVQYATSARWEHSSVATTWKLPDGSSDPSAMPEICAQSFYGGVENCLSMVLYVPPNLSTQSNVPTFLWIHGGSFILGSASATGLDGSSLAVATNSIVAVMQYRLGALGFMAPDGKTNLALEDSINALKFLQKVVPSFGGSASKITIGGQSSGATMVRALLATPSASSLFQNAVLQSDTMDAGFLSSSAQKNLQVHFNSLIGGCASSSCWNDLSLDDIIDASFSQFLASASVEPQAGSFAPMRPVNDGNLINTPLDSTAAFPTVSKPVLITTVNHEAGNAIYGNYTSALTAAQFAEINANTFGQDRASTIVASSNYAVKALDEKGTIDARVQLEEVGTDYLWKCSSWTFARNWASNGGKAYVGMYSLGSSYPSNANIDFCQQSGVVCHEDDIEIVFGTVPSPSSAQSSLVSQMQKRYKAFLNGGNPNADGLTTWTAAGSSDVHPLNLGGVNPVPVGACDPSFWGSAVKYDYQVYNI